MSSSLLRFVISRPTSSSVSSSYTNFRKIQSLYLWILKDPVFGPPVLLLLGFQVHEAQKIQELLKELDGEFMKIKFCTEDMIPRSLWEAVNTRQTDLKRVEIGESLPRICFLSGLTGEEMMMFIDAFPESGLEPAVFAAMVPNSADKPISELMEEIMGDHELLNGSASS